MQKEKLKIYEPAETLEDQRRYIEEDAGLNFDEEYNDQNWFKERNKLFKNYKDSELAIVSSEEVLSDEDNEDDPYWTYDEFPKYIKELAKKKVGIVWEEPGEVLAFILPNKLVEKYFEIVKE